MTQQQPLHGKGGLQVYMGVFEGACGLANSEPYQEPSQALCLQQALHTSAREGQVIYLPRKCCQVMHMAIHLLGTFGSLLMGAYICYVSAFPSFNERACPV